jgi:hypothetical protein
MLNNENLLNTVKSYIENRQFLSAKKIINGILKINKKNIEALYLDAIINRLTDKIDLAKLIVESSGKKWLPSYDSSGGTITKEGMVAIQESIFGLI